MVVPSRCSLQTKFSFYHEYASPITQIISEFDPWIGFAFPNTWESKPVFEGNKLVTLPLKLCFWLSWSDYSCISILTNLNSNNQNQSFNSYFLTFGLPQVWDSRCWAHFGHVDEKPLCALFLVWWWQFLHSSLVIRLRSNKISTGTSLQLAWSTFQTGRTGVHLISKLEVQLVEIKRDQAKAARSKITGARIRYVCIFCVPAFSIPCSFKSNMQQNGWLSWDGSHYLGSL